MAKFAISHLQRTSRPLRIAVDISIWLFQIQAAHGGANPALRTLFFRLNRLVSLPVQPIFVYDGPHRPSYKRGKIISRSSGGNAQLELSKQLIELFSFQWHVAPGEAEAECAKLQRSGVVDAVISNDVDALMFGSTVTLLNFSKEGTATQATHVDIYCTKIAPNAPDRNVFLDTGAMVLFALLSGGDYHPAGVNFCGRKLAGEICRAGFGSDLLEATNHLLMSGSSETPETLKDWKHRLQYELETNESGYFKTKHKAVKIPDGFPDVQVLRNCVYPVTSTLEQLERFRNPDIWDRDIHISRLRDFVGDKLGWVHLPGAKNFIRKIAPSIVCHQLLKSSLSDDKKQLSVSGRKVNNGMDGLIELKLEYVPMQVVGLDLGLETLPRRSQVDNIPDSPFSGDEEELATNPLPLKKRTMLDYDPTARQTMWVFEDILRYGLPETVNAWYTAQEAKAASKNKKVKKAVSRKPKSKVIDPSMKVGAIRNYGIISKKQTHLASSTLLASEKNYHPTSSLEIPCAEYRPDHRTSKSGASASTSSQLDSWNLTSSDVEAAVDSSCGIEGTSQFVEDNPPFVQRLVPNTNIPIARSVDQLEMGLRDVHISSSHRTRRKANTAMAKSTEPKSNPPARSRKSPTSNTTECRRPNFIHADPETTSSTLISLSRLTLDDDDEIPSPGATTLAESSPPRSLIFYPGDFGDSRRSKNKENANMEHRCYNTASNSRPSQIDTTGKERPKASSILENTPGLVVDAHKGFWFYRRQGRSDIKESDDLNEHYLNPGKKPTSTKRLGGIAILDLTL